MIIPEKKYRELLEYLPILCVDIIVPMEEGYLLLKRNNEPKKGRWWVPGGRIHKGETALAAAVRKVREETGLKISEIKPLGYYEAIFKKSSFGLVKRGYHVLSIVFLCRADSQNIYLDQQSSKWKIGKLPKDFKIKKFFQGEPI